MKKYRLEEIDAGLLSGGFENHGQNISALKSLMDLFGNLKHYGKNPEDFIKSHPDFVFSGRITKVVTDRIIRPYIIVSDKLEFMDKKKLSEVIKYNINLFAAYFLQAIKILSNVYNVDVTMIARQVTDKTLIKSTSKMLKNSKSFAGIEDNSDLVISTILKDSLNISAGTEDDDVEVEEETETTPARHSVKTTTTDISFKDAEKELKVNDTFIKIVNVDLKIATKDDNNKTEMKVTLPFVIAPIVVYTNATNYIKNVLGTDEDETFFTRWLKYRSGEIGFFDLVFAGDLINDYKRNKIENKNDVAELIKNKNLQNATGSIMTGEGGFNSFTNIYIFDKSDELMIEDTLQEDLIDGDVWQDLAVKLLAFDINFVDADKESITNFITDMPTYTVMSFRDIKKSDKNNDEINELLKAMLINKPVF